MKSQNSNQEIGRRVSSLRKQHKYTQAQLAQIINVTSKHLSEIERGVTGMSIDVQILLSEVLKCSIDYLVKGENYQTIEHILPEFLVEILKAGNRDEIETLQEYLALYEKIHGGNNKRD